MKHNHKNIRTRGNPFFYAAWLVLAFIPPLFAGGSLQPISLVNTAINAAAGGSGDSLAPVITPDGRYVLFASSANNLTWNNVTNLNPSPVPLPMNIYLRDRVGQTTTLVSVNSTGNGIGNGDSIPAGISDNGRYALFESAASNLVPNDTNGVNDIFVRDLMANTTTLVSVGTNGSVANGASRSSVITSDGRYVAFVSAASNLTRGVTNGPPNIYVRDLQADTTTLVTPGAMQASTTLNSSISSSELPLISSDGRYVSFYSTATNLVAGITNSGEVYVRDLLLGTTTWASINTVAILQTFGTNASRSCNQAMSTNGQFVAYEACCSAIMNYAPVSGSGAGFILRYNTGSGQTDIICSNAMGIMAGNELNERNLTITPDGRFTAFVASVNGVNSGVGVWDAQSGLTTTVNLDQFQNPVSNAIYDWPTITPDGRFVAFVSTATNLTPNVVDAGFHLYVRDLQAQANTLVDVDTNGVGSTVALMTYPRLSDDGSVVAFDSPDGSLVANDFNHAEDVFVRNFTTSANELISVSLPSLAPAVPNAACDLGSQCVSTNGRYVVFTSQADNLGPVTAYGQRNVLVHDLFLGTNILVSANTNGVPGNGLSTGPAISGSGRYVVFTSYATDLVTNPLLQATNVFRRDLQAGTTALVSVSTNRVSSGNGYSFSPSISADGNVVTYVSIANNLAPGDNYAPGSTLYPMGNLYWRDMSLGTNRLITNSVSSSVQGVYLDSANIGAGMTPDGQNVTYYQYSSYGSGGLPGLFLWNAVSNKTTKSFYNGYPSFTPGYQAGISPDGNWCAFYSQIWGFAENIILLTNASLAKGMILTNVGNFGSFQFSGNSQSFVYTDGTNLIYQYNLVTGSNVCITLGANGQCDSPTVSSDGRFVAYRSFASNLVANTSSGVPNILLYDSQAKTTILVTTSPFGLAPANGRSLKPVFSGDGQTLLWQSWAANLAGQGLNQWCNLYALQSFATNAVPSPGQPPNISSFGVSPVAVWGASAFASTLSWPVIAGTNYQVQFTDNLNHPNWHPVTSPVQILGTQAYVADPATNNIQRYYRVVAY